jgi:predicted anti-sigma-YlaC factor YlaD
VTDYLEGALPPEEQARFEEHSENCTGCREYLKQMRSTLELTGQLRPDDLSAEAERALLAAFRDWKSA